MSVFVIVLRFDISNNVLSFMIFIENSPFSVRYELPEKFRCWGWLFRPLTNNAPIRLSCNFRRNLAVPKGNGVHGKSLSVFSCIWTGMVVSLIIVAFENFVHHLCYSRVFFSLFSRFYQLGKEPKRMCQVVCSSLQTVAKIYSRGIGPPL